MSKGYGKPKVGGPFILQDLEGKDVTEKDLLGKYSIVSDYLGEHYGRKSVLTHGLTDLLRLHPLSRHLPRRARQAISRNRHPEYQPNISTRLPLDLHFRRPSPRYACRSQGLPRRIPSSHSGSDWHLATDQRHMQGIPSLLLHTAGPEAWRGGLLGRS